MAADAPPIRLTALSHGGGCACKIGPDQLEGILGTLPVQTDPDLLVGADTRDDAGVYRLSPELAIIQTADFFTPIVDDPYDFGRIAAANALSDVYAMGGTPVLAINLVAYSIPALGPDPLEEILRGGAEVVREAGATLAGGHSIDDHEPKYGMAVTGVVHPDEVITNAGGRAGDELFLTKPVGGGLITTASKRGLADDSRIRRATEVMCELNAAAAAAARDAGATAMTDITGFGLLGHVGELCEASGVSAEIRAAAVPSIEGSLDLAGDERCIAGGTRRNGAYAARFTEFASDVGAERRILLTDAMTSGGLLVAVPPHRAAQAPGVRIGRLVEAGPARIVVV
jgi:selenide,water dikinase